MSDFTTPSGEGTFEGVGLDFYRHCYERAFAAQHIFTDNARKKIAELCGCGYNEVQFTTRGSARLKAEFRKAHDFVPSWTPYAERVQSAHWDLPRMPEYPKGHSTSFSRLSEEDIVRMLGERREYEAALKVAEDARTQAAATTDQALRDLADHWAEKYLPEALRDRAWALIEDTLTSRGLRGRFRGYDEAEWEFEEKAAALIKEQA